MAPAALERLEIQISGLTQVRTGRIPFAGKEPHLLVHPPQDPEGFLVLVTLPDQAGQEIPGPEKKAAFDQRKTEQLGQAQVRGEVLEALLQDLVGEHGLAQAVGQLPQLQVEVGLTGPDGLVTGLPELVDRGAVVGRACRRGIDRSSSCPVRSWRPRSSSSLGLHQRAACRLRRKCNRVRVRVPVYPIRGKYPEARLWPCWPPAPGLRACLSGVRLLQTGLAAVL